MAEETELLTIEETAQRLGVSVPTVHNLVKRKKLRKVKRAYGWKRTFFKRAEVEALARGEEQPKRKEK